MQEDDLDVVQNRREKLERRTGSNRRAEKKTYEGEDRRNGKDRRTNGRRILGQPPKA